LLQCGHRERERESCEHGSARERGRRRNKERKLFGTEADFGQKREVEQEETNVKVYEIDCGRSGENCLERMCGRSPNANVFTSNN
jgi:hypothetical protein